ncbi:hypothetical protein TH25_14915 [Thalassospira profundimaris]|uniref:Adenylate cyclase n=1 Tax=Thalassospira profundimaris TaxID=502049 RepID=A0A367X3W0_9PROT|nr:DUF3095 domain-containing protein [Thalassospira profundimaris]RCK48345.1 hypothetical protein TH25_14915 [Thalassospira profundimaris]
MPNSYLAIPTFHDFARILDPASYHALPDDWYVGVADIVASTEAIAKGRYKDVNMAGAAVIAAISNILGHSAYPFMFGGDGAGFACAPDHIDDIREALAATRRWVADDLGLELRVALFDIGEIRAAGRDVRVARYAVSDAISYAMFNGQGLQWAEMQMKSRNDHHIAAAPPGTRPDLTGLSCRWSPIAASQNGSIISLIVHPAGDRANFDAVVGKILALLDQTPNSAHPVSATGPLFRFPPAGLTLEAKANRPVNGALLAAKTKVFLTAALAFILDKTGWKLGNFDPAHYRRYTALNTDYRKFGDALFMTVNCSAEQLEHLQKILTEGENAGHIGFGLHRQNTAIMTCIVPSVVQNDHFHFLDGGEGGYSAAAAAYKAKQPAMADPGVLR